MQIFFFASVSLSVQNVYIPLFWYHISHKVGSTSALVLLNDILDPVGNQVLFIGDFPAISAYITQNCLSGWGYIYTTGGTYL